jgi:hypothetical protein
MIEFGIPEIRLRFGAGAGDILGRWVGSDMTSVDRHFFYFTFILFKLPTY